MGFFNRLVNKKSNKQVISAMNDLIKLYSTQTGGDLGTTNKRALNRIFGRSPWYKALVSKRGRDIARIPLFLKDKSDSSIELIENHVLLDLFNNFNTEMVGLQARQLLQVYYDNLGEWILWVVKNKLDVPIALYPINPADVMVKGSENEKWQINTLTGLQEIDNSDIIYCRDIDPEFPYGRGAGQGQAMSDEISIAEKINKLLGITFDNKAVPPFIINFEDAGDTEIELAQKKWLNKLKGVQNFAKPMFTNSKIGVQKLGMTFEETKIIELRKAEEDMFRRIWGIPAELLGDLGTSNRASSLNAYNIYADNVLSPNLDLFVQKMQVGLVEPYNKKNGTNLQLWYKSPNKADEGFILEVMKAFPMDFEANEIRNVAHHDKWEDERGNKVWIPLNFTDRSPANNGTNDNIVKGTPQEKEKVSLSKLVKSKKKIKLKEIFKVNIEDVEIEEESELSEEALLALLLALLNFATPLYLFDKVSASILDVIQSSGVEGLAELGIDVPIDTNSTNIIDYMDDVLNKTSVFITNTIKDDIKKTLEEGTKDKLTNNQLIDKLNKDVFDRYKTGDKKDKIVETEATSIVNFARNEILLQSNVAVQKEWITQRDEKVRGSHLIDGQLKNPNENFILTNGNLAMYPGDVNLPPEDRINERCGLGYHNGQVSFAGQTEEQRTGYWNNFRAEIEKHKRVLGDAYTKAFQDMQIELNKLIREV